ncbi:NADH-quinone oxidoreductase subunit J [Kineosporia sp. NBRC 101731]|uniref:NADH-quinone oxidoreductase subunit J family protein n=1 Tax=Kineosporia sp. NBRC 101731 TaxID=3032199 RepID=UPI0024A29990|nr:NADH-quinone oxidoreductase subunit J [Kineosporia sp. NBRC 101731]GLY27646.1 NADH dehydrogenase [Kineosporia sp. NBRC 101731]
MSGLDLLLTALAVLAAASALLAVTGSRVVHCALWLVVSLGALAGVYLVLGAEVVALVQLLVYVGAVVVLVIFALMLTRAPVEPSSRLDAPKGQKLAAVVAGISVGGILAGTLIYALQDLTVEVQGEQGSARNIGQAVFSGWLLPFELLSVLLLAALVAAIAVSRHLPGTTEDGGEQ